LELVTSPGDREHYPEGLLKGLEDLPEILGVDYKLSKVLPRFVELGGQ
jgi:hypothetical protein